MNEDALRFLRLQHASVHAQKKNLTAELKLNLENPANRMAAARREKIKERLSDLDVRQNRLEAQYRGARKND